MAHLDNSHVWTIVVAAGSGSRFGNPKQFESLGTKSVLDCSIENALAVSEGVVVVLPAENIDLNLPPRCVGVVGGQTRSESVRAGLAKIPKDATVICVHDAARPLASVGLFRRVIESVFAGADGAIPGLPLADTIKEVDEVGRVERTLPRHRLVAVQTPQAFNATKLRAAHSSEAQGTDDAEVVERAGGMIVVVNGETSARKITLVEDLDWARSQVGEQ